MSFASREERTGHRRPCEVSRPGDTIAAPSGEVAESGRTRLPAKEVAAFRWPVGSNPTLSAPEHVPPEGTDRTVRSSWCPPVTCGRRRGWVSCPLATSRQRVAARLNPASTPRPSTARDWRRGWDSNPRALADKTLSRRPRYDHFGTSPGREPVRLPPSRSALRRPRKPDTTFDGGRCSARTTIPARTFHYTGRGVPERTPRRSRTRRTRHVGPRR